MGRGRSPDNISVSDERRYTKNPGFPNFRTWALQPVPTMQVGAAALGYPDSLKMTKRHEIPPTVIANEFTAAGVTQDCADDLARIINDAFAGMWDQQSDFYVEKFTSVVYTVSVSFMTVIVLLFPLIPTFLIGEFFWFTFIMYVPIAFMLVFMWLSVVESMPKYMGPKFEFGMKALENAQPALRECLARHGVNGTVRPAREMEGLQLVTFCAKTVIRFWVRLEVSTPQTNPQYVLTYNAGLPVVPQFWIDLGRLSRAVLKSYEQGLETVKNAMILAMNSAPVQLKVYTPAPVAAPVAAPAAPLVEMSLPSQPQMPVEQTNYAPNPYMPTTELAPAAFDANDDDVQYI